MALQVNTIRSATNTALTPRIPVNKIITGFDGWTKFSNGTGVAPVESGTNNDTVTLAKTAGTGRSWVSTAATLEAGKSYALGCFVVSRTGDLSRNEQIFASLSITAGSRSIKDDNPGQWWCCRFTAAATTSAPIRLGIGPADNDSGSITNMVLSSPFLYELDSLTSDVPEYVAGYGAMDNTTFPAAAFSFAASGTPTADSGGQITYTLADQTPLIPRPYSVGFFVGDSFANDSTEWPARFCTLDSHMLLLGNGTSGAALNDFDTVFQDLIDLDGFDYTGDVLPEFVIIQSSVNSPNELFTVDQMLASILSMINKAKAAGLHAIVTNIPPYGQSSSYDSNTEGQLVSVFNQRLKGFCDANSASYVDIFNVLVNSTGYEMRAEFVSGDTLHPNEAGSTAIAGSILKVVQQLRKNSSGSSGGIIGKNIISR